MPPPPPVYTWTGVYGGVNIGGAWLRTYNYNNLIWGWNGAGWNQGFAWMTQMDRAAASQAAVRPDITTKFRRFSLWAWRPTSKERASEAAGRPGTARRGA